MKTILPLNGGMNKDVNELFIDSQNGEVIERRNCRVLSIDGSKYRINSSIKGMDEVSLSLPSGDNTIIGQVEDKEREQLVLFSHNSNGDHSVVTFDGTTTVDLGVSGGVLSFSINNPIDADVLGDYVFFTDNINPPRKLLLTSPSPSILADSLSIANVPPVNAPSWDISSDSTRELNLLLGRSFQFAYQYIYSDNTYSVLSPYSGLLVSPSEFSISDNTYIDNSFGNLALVTVQLGGGDVNRVVTYARESNIGTWFIIDDYTKPTGTIGGSRDISFYNDRARSSIATTEALTLFSDVPRLAKSLSVVENRVTLQNVLKGYDNPSPSVEYDVTYEDVDLSGGAVTLVNTTGSSGGDFYTEWILPTTFTAGSAITVVYSGEYVDLISPTVVRLRFQFFYTFSYVFSENDAANPQFRDVLGAMFVSDIEQKGGDIIISTVPIPEVDIAGTYNSTTGAVRLVFVGAGNGSVRRIFERTFSVTTPTSGTNTHKAGSYRSVGIVFYDQFNRTPGVSSPFNIYVPSNGERDYADINRKAVINFEIISLNAPSWATHYRFAISESTNFSGVFPFLTGSRNGGNAFEDIYVDGKRVIAISLPENLDYSYVNGDILVLETDTGSAISTLVKTIIGVRSSIEAGGNVESGNWLIIPQGNQNVATYQDSVSYIYRPKSTVGDLIFFETPQTYLTDLLWSQVGNSLLLTVPSASIASLSDSQIALLLSGSGGNLSTYSFDGTNWSQVGNAFSFAGITGVSVTGLSSTQVALVSASINELRTYSFDGTDWSQVGNSLAITLSSPSIASLSSSSVALYNSGTDELTYYSWDGTDWSQVGNSLVVSNMGSTTIEGISATEIAYHDSDTGELRVYSWDGADWSQAGNSLIIGNSSSSGMANLSSNRVAFIDSFNDLLTTYAWDGTSWSATGGRFVVSNAGNPALGALGDNRIAYIDTNNNQLRTYQFAPVSSIGQVGGEDAWFTQRDFEYNNGTMNVSSTETVEDFYINIDSRLRAYSQGRPVVASGDFGERRLQDFVWSDAYLDNTLINGVSTFRSTNRFQLDEKNGEINRTLLVGDVVKVVQDNKETSLYVGKEQITNADGSLQLIRSGNFIGTSYPSVDDYGSRDSLSVLRHNRNLYYFDRDRGEVIRSSPNGQIVISDYGMKSEFLRVKRLIESSPSASVLGGYDIRNDEYILTFEIGSYRETFVFNENENRWVSYYDYTNASGNIPSLHGRIGEQLYSFLGGSAWSHETSTAQYNTFFGSSKALSIIGVLNIYPREEKCLRALETDSTRGMDTVIESQVTNTNPVGQKTVLNAESYRDRQGKFTSAVYSNILQVGGTENMGLLHTGNDMVGQYLTIMLSDDNPTEMELRLLTANFTVNR